MHTSYVYYGVASSSLNRVLFLSFLVSCFYRARGYKSAYICHMWMGEITDAL